MNSVALLHEALECPVLPDTRRELAGWLRRLGEQIGADSYMLLDLARGGRREAVRIVASDWVFDAIEDVGEAAFARIAAAPATPFTGAPPQVWRPSAEGCDLALVDAAEAEALEAGGHRELAAARIRAGALRFCLIFSARHPGSIEGSRLWAAQMMASYALSRLAGTVAAKACADPLSERERECLAWVSEGKTTDEVATILDVSPNTANSYLAHAIRKLSASNRAMAVATAIRAGII